jgi:hypothetical protein
MRDARPIGVRATFLALRRCRPQTLFLGVIFGSFMASSQPPPSSPVEPWPDTHAGVEKALVDLLAFYTQQHRSFSAWDCHCLDAALTFLRYGYYEQAGRMVADILRPPVPLPSFTIPRTISFDDVRRALAEARIAASFIDSIAGPGEESDPPSGKSAAPKPL